MMSVKNIQDVSNVKNDFINRTDKMLVKSLMISVFGWKIVQ